jgi:hypothetical protein
VTCITILHDGFKACTRLGHDWENRRIGAAKSLAKPQNLVSQSVRVRARQLYIYIRTCRIAVYRIATRLAACHLLFRTTQLPLKRPSTYHRVYLNSGLLSPIAIS